jgi:phosphoglucosamine mutase
VRRHGFDLGVVLSASHNPYRDNGIKFFGGDGLQALRRDRARDRGDARARRPRRDPAACGASTARSTATSARSRRASSDLDLTGRRILLDCANGATFEAAPAIFRRLGADVEVIAPSPTGATSTTAAARRTSSAAPRDARGGHDAGFAFDGDGDRVLAVDRNGVVVDGDELIALAALHLRACRGVAVTVMTNYGFHTAMRAPASRSRPRRSATATCSRRCASAAGRSAASSPGTSSRCGFVPVRRRHRRRAAHARGARGGDLADRHAMEKLPQKLVNVRVRDRDASSSPPTCSEAVERESAALEGRGRVLLRRAAPSRSCA